MTKKPSLYVVERKEVVILVVLFVLVTVLAFTMGVKYGENLGQKQAREKQAAETAFADTPGTAGGHLGSDASTAKPAAHGSVPETASGGHGEAGHGDDGHGAKPADQDTGDKTHAEAGHGAGHGDTHDAHVPPAATPSAPLAGAAPKTPGAKSADLQDTDEYLLNALKEAGIEKSQANAQAGAPVRKQEAENLDEESARPHAGGDAGEEDEAAKLPTQVKGKAGKPPVDDYWVIQVASYPTEQEAKRHAERLRAQSLEPIVFSGMDSKSGKWYRVALGKYADKERAGEVARTYKQKGWIGSSSFVRKAP